MSKKVSELLSYGIEELKSVCDRPLLESEILLGSAIDKSRVWLHTNKDALVDSSIFIENIARRKTHEPLEYITSKVSFYSREFNIENGVLIPRPETEILVDLVNDYIDNKEITVCEVGVGSGIISIMLAILNPNIKVIGTDINPKAIDLSRKNAKKFGVEDRVEFRHCSMLDFVSEKIDLLVSNPPYIANEYTLPENVRYEPKEALFGGEIGDEFLKELINLWIDKKIPILFCEFGYDQKEPISNFVNEKKEYKISFYKDLSDIDRGFVIKKC